MYDDRYPTFTFRFAVFLHQRHRPFILRFTVSSNRFFTAQRYA